MHRTRSRLTDYFLISRCRSFRKSSRDLRSLRLSVREALSPASVAPSARSLVRLFARCQAREGREEEEEKIRAEPTLSSYARRTRERRRRRRRRRAAGGGQHTNHTRGEEGKERRQRPAAASRHFRSPGITCGDGGEVWKKSLLVRMKQDQCSYT